MLVFFHYILEYSICIFICTIITLLGSIELSTCHKYISVLYILSKFLVLYIFPFCLRIFPITLSQVFLSLPLFIFCWDLICRISFTGTELLNLCGCPHPPNFLLSIKLASDYSSLLTWSFLILLIFVISLTFLKYFISTAWIWLCCCCDSTQDSHRYVSIPRSIHRFENGHFCLICYFYFAYDSFVQGIK